jgi:hypothetical protein
MDPPELASEPPRSRIGAASNSAPELRRLGWVMLGDLTSLLGAFTKNWAHVCAKSNLSVLFVFVLDPLLVSFLGHSTYGRFHCGTFKLLQTRAFTVGVLLLGQRT